MKETQKQVVDLTTNFCEISKDNWICSSRKTTKERSNWVKIKLKPSGRQVGSSAREEGQKIDKWVFCVSLPSRETLLSQQTECEVPINIYLSPNIFLLRNYSSIDTSKTSLSNCYFGRSRLWTLLTTRLSRWYINGSAGLNLRMIMFSGRHAPANVSPCDLAILSKHNQFLAGSVTS